MKIVARMVRPVPLVAAAALVAFAARLAGAQTGAATHASPAAALLRVPVAARAMARGEVIGAADIVYRDTTLREPLDTSTVAAGWVTRRTIAAGEVLRAPAVMPPILVVANDMVQADWNDGGVHLSVQGTVNRSASLGERVMVRTDSGRRIEAIVVAAGRVRIE